MVSIIFGGCQRSFWVFRGQTVDLVNMVYVEGETVTNLILGMSVLHSKVKEPIIFDGGQRSSVATLGYLANCL